MASGLKTLHGIDSAIRNARNALSEAAKLPQQANEALVNVQRKQAILYEQIASERLELIEADGGGEALGYVDRQAAAFLDAHTQEEDTARDKVTAQSKAVERLEDARRQQEKSVTKAVDGYDKAVAVTEARLIKDAAYTALTDTVERLENTVIRAEEKLAMARQDEKGKGVDFLNDPFFAYLQKRGFAEDKPKGWVLTKLLDKWVAGKINYRDQAVTYRRLTDIPKRLAAHAQQLEMDVVNAQDALHIYEAKALEDDGAKAKQEASKTAQAALDKIDADMEAAEAQYQQLLSAQLSLNSGDSGPYREAVEVIAATLKRKDLPGLNRIAAQTRGKDDDEAVAALRELAHTARDLEDDRQDAKRLAAKYQRSLKDLEKVRRRFKTSRYDAPSSNFGQDDLIGAMLGQVVSGVVGGDDFWRQLQRAQRTLQRYSDLDFGGMDWEEGFRLPRSGGRSGRRSSGGRSSNGWGGGNSRRRTSLPRSPRRSLPRSNRGGGFGGSSRSGGRKSGRFKTGGGF